MTSRIDVEFPCARMQVLVPMAVADEFHSRERYPSILYRKAVCMELLNTMSYRKGCSSFNYHRQRTGGQALPVSTFVSDILEEGENLIATKRSSSRQILESYGFDGETGQYRGDTLPEKFHTHRHSFVRVSPDEILTSMTQGTWDPENPGMTEAPADYLETGSEEQGYSQPDMDEVQYTKTRRRKNRTPESPESIPGICRNYTEWRNSQGMYSLCRILHTWELETNPAEVVYIMIDAVYVPGQTGVHVKEGSSSEKPSEKKEDKRVTHWNIKAEWENNRSYIITDEFLDNAFLQLLAFLLVNDFITRFFVFLTDGENSIFTGIEKYFSHWEHTVYLDYAHIEKKCYELLSLAIIGKRTPDPRGEKKLYVRGPKKGQIRKQDMTSLSVLYTRRVTSILWAGNVNEAIRYLSNIDPHDIHDPARLELLKAYLDPENKGKYITCYALRRRVGLRNSSNGVEGVNNMIVASDQKIGSKTYRSNGSHTAAALAALQKNREWDTWFETDRIAFRYLIPEQ